MHKTLDIHKFNMNRIKPGSTCVLIGKRNSGKTFLIKDILFHKRNIPIGTIISQTESNNGNFEEHMPSTFIHEKYTSSILKDVFKKQKNNIDSECAKYPNQLKKNVVEHMKKYIKNYCFVLLDDCLSDAKVWKNDDYIKKIFYEGRHSLIFFLLTMQIPLGIPPGLRGNIDFTFITLVNNANDKKKIYENYAGCFENINDFKTVLDDCTEGYKCLVIDNTSRSNKIEDQVFWYEAKDNGAFKLCSEDTWNYHYYRLKQKKQTISSTNTVGRNTITVNKYLG